MQFSFLRPNSPIRSIRATISLILPPMPGGPEMWLFNLKQGKYVVKMLVHGMKYKHLQRGDVIIIENAMYGNDKNIILSDKSSIYTIFNELYDNCYQPDKIDII